MNDYFTKNLAILETRFPFLYQRLIDGTINPVGDPVNDDQGKVINLKLQKKNKDFVYLHPDGHEAEIFRYFNMIPEDSHGVVIMIGMGLGFALNEIILKRSNIHHLIVFEPDPGIFIQAMHHNDLTAFLSDPRAMMEIGENLDIERGILEISRALQMEDIFILQQQGSFQYAPEIYIKVKDRVFSNANRYNTGGSTVRKHGKDSFRNRMDSLTTYSRTFKFEELRGAAKNIPAIIVAAGPSLDKNIHLLSGLRHKAVIFSVDSALKTLLKHNCVPDFVSAIDYKDIVWEKIAGLTSRAPEVSLICSSSVCSKIPKVFPAKSVFWMFTIKNMDHWLSFCIGNRTMSTGTGTVAHVNLIAANIMGCSPIIFVGQDLCYPDDKDHADDVVLSNRENWQKLLKDKIDIIPMKPNYGDKPLLGCRSMFIYKEIFEEIIQANPKEYINATEGGVYIAGTRVMGLEQAGKTYCNKTYDIESMMAERTQKKNMISVKQLVSEFKKIRSVVSMVEKKTGKTDKLAEIIIKNIKGKEFISFSDLPENIRKKISRMDALHGEIDNEEVLWSLLEELTSKGLKADERRKHEIRLLEKTSYHYMNWLEKSIDRLGEINIIRKEVLSSFRENLDRVISYYEKEEGFLSLDGKKLSSKILYDLCNLYYKAGNFSFLQSLLNKLGPEEQHIPRVLFYKGVLACHYGEYEQSEADFARAAKDDPNLGRDILKVREKQGDEYYEFAQSQKEIDLNVMAYMVFKGLRMAPFHEGLIHELNLYFQSAVEDLSAVVAKDRDAAGRIIDAWMKHFIENPHIYKLLNPIDLCRFHRFYGIFCFDTGNNKEGLLQFQKYQKYMFKSGEMPTSQICIQEGEFLHLKGYFQDARTWYKKALDIDSVNVVAWHDMGKALQDQRVIHEAEKCYRRAIELSPQFYQSYYNLALLLYDAGYFKEALDSCDTVIRINPGFIYAYNTRGIILKSMGRLATALDFFNRAVALNGDFTDALNNAGIVYQELGITEKAIEMYERVMQKDPNNEITLFNLNNLMQNACNWEKIIPYGELLKKSTMNALDQKRKPAENPFHSLLHYDDQKIQLEIAKAYSREINSKFSNYRRSLSKALVKKDQKIRIGYLSSDFRDHALGHIVSGLFAKHDKKSFCLYGYSATAVNPDDDFTAKIQNSCNRFVDISEMSPKDAAKIIQNDEIDILMDMTGFARQSKLAICAIRPARVMISFLGFLGTTGSDFMDYMITDRIVTPEQAGAHYSEKFLYMPDCYQAMDYSHLISEKKWARKDFNLPENRIVFCSFNQPYKYCKTIFSTWVRILNRVPGSVLWLRKTNKETKTNLINFVTAQGISSERLIFSESIPLADHIERLKLADIALDPILYNGGITTNNALWAGLPVITMPGKTFVQRMSASTLNASNLDELVLDTLSAYEDKAVELALSQQALTLVKEKIDGARKLSPVFDTALYVKNLETLFKEIMHRY